MEIGAGGTPGSPHAELLARRWRVGGSRRGRRAGWPGGRRGGCAPRRRLAAGLAKVARRVRGFYGGMLPLF
ncbi:hypothetical protein E2562_003627 [Oryza meyeriana var. granulata]|uniref:Uncharacterized protein n=1 Tax=Oryza meyeriana var. granulata TaxID=110450 RepID=A0A6G1CMI6_9ORYZ|nr:hypothetical protein E2562_003627 [Oryza meyeriana var. granulata]